jgi:nitric oxide reductase large subunit
MENGQFFSTYNLSNGKGIDKPSPYYDGESLLALVKAAKYMGYTDLEQTIKKSAQNMYEVNIVHALAEDPDSNTTKGFFQWSSMAYYELYTSGWDDTEKYGRRIIDLSHWMIDVHRTLRRMRNTAYAYEGIIHAWETARLANDIKAVSKSSKVIDEGLYKLTTWQVGHLLQNEYLREHPTHDPLAVGGVLNHKSEPFLRIDVTQHQMHAVILGLKYLNLPD